LFVDDLRNHQVLEQVHAPVLVTFGGDPAGLGGGVNVEWGHENRL